MEIFLKNKLDNLCDELNQLYDELAEYDNPAKNESYKKNLKAKIMTIEDEILKLTQTSINSNNNCYRKPVLSLNYKEVVLSILQDRIETISYENEVKELIEKEIKRLKSLIRQDINRKKHL